MPRKPKPALFDHTTLVDAPLRILRDRRIALQKKLDRTGTAMQEIARDLAETEAAIIPLEQLARIPSSDHHAADQ